MKPRILSLLFPLLFPILLVAQETVFSLPMGTGKGYLLRSSVCYNQKDGTFCLFLKDNDKVRYLLFSKDMQLLDSISSPPGFRNTVYMYEKQSYMYGFYNEEGYNFFYSIPEKSNSHLRVQTVNFKTHKLSTDKNFALSESEWYIRDFFINGKYYYLTVDNENDQINSYIIEENGKLVKKHSPLGLKGFYDLKKLKPNEYFSYAKEFESKQESGLKESSSLTKFFIYPDHVTLVVQNFKEPPHIIDMNLQSFKLTKRKLAMDEFCGFVNKKEAFNNSYLYGPNLYVLNVCKDMIEIGVYDTLNWKLIKRHEISANDETFFAEDASSSVSIGKTEKEKELKTAGLIKKMMKYTLAIAVGSNINHNLVLTCGTYDELQVGGGGYYTPGFTIRNLTTGTTGTTTPVITPTLTYDPNKFYYKRQSQKATIVTSFKLVLDSANFTILPNESVDTYYDIICGITKEYQPTSTGRNLIRSNGKLYFSFYDEMKKVFVIQYMGEDKL